MLLVAAIVLGVMFVEWPEHAMWNTRFLPFWLLTWGFIAAMGATEILRWMTAGCRRRVRWIREGDLSGRARPGVDRAGARTPTVPMPKPTKWSPRGRWRTTATRVAVARGAAARTVVERSARRVSAHRDGRARRRHRRVVGEPGVGGAQRQPDIAIQSVGPRWNYSGYEKKPSWPEYSRDLRQTMGTLPPTATARCGSRRRWTADPINNYGTSLALELLPYCTNGRIGSMEGLYFESSATTSFHFLTVSELAAHPSNPVRGLVYGSLAPTSTAV